MSRPFAYIGFSWFAASVAAVFLGGKVSAVLGAIGLVALVGAAFFSKLDFIRTKKVLSAALAAVSLAFLVYGISDGFGVQPYEKLDGSKAFIKGEILEYAEERYNKYYYLVEVDYVELETGKADVKPFKTRITSTKPIVAEPHDRIEGNVTFFAYKDGYGFSSKSSYLAKGVKTGAYMSGYECVVVKTVKPFAYYLKAFRQELLMQVKVVLPAEEASLINAILLGERSGISDKVDRDFKIIGQTHLLVVSGMHMTTVSCMLIALLSALRFRKRLRNLLGISAVVCYMLITGTGTSVVRSGIMMILFLVADSMGRETDSINTLGFAVTVMCIPNPYIGGDIGFILSVLSTLGILVLNRPFARIQGRILEKLPRCRKLAGVVLAPLFVTLSAMAFTLPVQIYVIGGVALLSPLAGLLLLIPSTLLLYVAFFGVLFLAIPTLSPLAMPFLLLSGLLARLILWIAASLARLDWTYIGVGNGNGQIIIAVFICMAALLLYTRPKLKTTLAAVAVIVLTVIGGIATNALRYHDVITVAIADAGEKSCVAVMKNGKGAVLSLGGYNTGLAETVFLHNNIREIPHILLQTADRNTSEAVALLAQNRTVDKLVAQQETYIDQILRRAAPGFAFEFYQGDLELELLEGVRAVCSADGTVVLQIHNKHTLCVETGESPPGKADFLITGRLDTGINSAFTVLQTDAIIIRDVAGINPGSAYVLACEQNITYLDFYPDGTIEIRREA